MPTRKKPNPKQGLKNLKSKALKPTESKAVRGGRGNSDILITKHQDKSTP